MTPDAVDWTRILIVVLQVLQLIGIFAIVGGLWLLVHAGVRRSDNGGVVEGDTADPHHPSCPARGHNDLGARALCVCPARRAR